MIYKGFKEIDIDNILQIFDAEYHEFLCNCDSFENYEIDEDKLHKIMSMNIRLTQLIQAAVRED